MNNMQFPIDLLIPGVVIVKDITCETKKDFLIPAGTTLTKEHINRCMLRNIKYAYIISYSDITQLKNKRINSYR